MSDRDMITVRLDGNEIRIALCEGKRFAMIDVGETRVLAPITPRRHDGRSVAAIVQVGKLAVTVSHDTDELVASIEGDNRELDRAVARFGLQDAIPDGVDGVPEKVKKPFSL